MRRVAAGDDHTHPLVRQDEDLGKIEDLILDAGVGRIAYAALSFGGFLGMGDKYFAISWNAFSFNLSEKHAVLSQARLSLLRDFCLVSQMY